jgi:hypothetical protein
MRIDDLAAPRQTEAALAAIATAAQVSVVLTVDAVLESARVQTGLSDFGAMDFAERLGIMLRSAEEDGLNEMGRLLFFNDMVRYAANRLLVEDVIRRHPEILDIPIDRPIIILGMPRTGTTHLVNMIAADKRLRSLPYWESLHPVAPRHGPDTRLADTEAGWAGLDSLLPMQKNVHELSPTHIHEEIELQMLDFSSYMIEWTSRAYRWRDWYLNHDQTGSFHYLKKVLQVLTWQRGPNRWVLKSPGHLEQIGPLLAAFPDATIVMTHRDPRAVVASCLTMNAYIDRLRRLKVNPAEVANYWVDRIERLLNACVRDHHLLPPGRSIDVRFGDFMADQIGTVRRVYEMAGLEMTPTAESEIQAYLDSHARDRHGQLEYDLEADFGLNPAKLRERFAAYSMRFGIESAA